MPTTAGMCTTKLMLKIEDNQLECNRTLTTRLLCFQQQLYVPLQQLMIIGGETFVCCLEGCEHDPRSCKSQTVSNAIDVDSSIHRIRPTSKIGMRMLWKLTGSFSGLKS